MARLGDVVEISASKKNISDSEIWLLNLDMVEQRTGNIIEYNYVSKDDLSGSIIQFDSDNVLYSKLRPNLNKVVVPNQDGFATSEMLPLRPNTAMLTKEFLAAYLRSDNFVTWAVSKTAGAKMPRLGTKELLNKDIPLPSIDKQLEITSVLAQIENLISLRKQQLAKLDELVKARFVEMFGEKISQEKGYRHSTLGAIYKFQYGKGNNIPESKGDYPVYGSNGQVGYHTEYNSEDAPIIGHIGAYAGIVNWGEGKHFVTYNGVICKLTNEFVNKKYGYYCLLMANLQNEVRGGSQPFVSYDLLVKPQIFIPPLDIQNQFAIFVEKVDESKLTIQQSLDKLEMLKKALMQEYFG